MEELKHDFLPEHLLPELKSAGFDGTIAVQARMTLDETRWLLKLADQNPFIKGVVGWVDLCSREADFFLRELSEHQKFVGVRHVVHDEPDDSFMARPEFQRGISQLEKYNLTYDLLIFPKHLPLARELVEKFPEQKFVLDHIAKPDIRKQEIMPWSDDIKKLARFPNVYCKLSGMVTEADWENWEPEDFSSYLDIVFECFGPERLMFGSDWPVLTVAASYAWVVRLISDYLESYTPMDREKVFGINCSEFYLSRKPITKQV